jgi:shikimate dehydrogenase
MELPSVNGLTRLYPVVGSPVSQVQAPAMFNPVFADCGINALVVPLDLPADEVVRTCRALLASPSIGGLLVTVPYKKTLYALVDHAGEEAQMVGAVNAIRRDADGAIVGDLFDGQGFVRGLQAAGRDPAGASVLLLGAGGAGSAIAAALAIANVAALRIFVSDQSSTPLRSAADVEKVRAHVGRWARDVRRDYGVGAVAGH